jgi:ribonuclease E
MKEKTQRVIAHVPVDVGTYLLNEKRGLLSELENRHEISVMLIPTPALETPNFDVQRIRVDDSGSERHAASYDLTLTREEVSVSSLLEEPRPQMEIPAVRAIAPPAPAPAPVTAPAAPVMQPATSAATSKPGFIKRVIGTLFGNDVSKLPSETQQDKTESTDSRPARDRNNNNRRRPNRSQEERNSANRPRRQPKPPREHNSSQPAETAADISPVSIMPGKEEGVTDQPRRSSRRGRRGGRRRGAANRSPEGQNAAVSENGRDSTTTASPSHGDNRTDLAISKSLADNTSSSGTQAIVSSAAPRADIISSPEPTPALVRHNNGASSATDPDSKGKVTAE